MTPHEILDGLARALLTTLGALDDDVHVVEVEVTWRGEAGIRVTITTEATQ